MISTGLVEDLKIHKPPLHAALLQGKARDYRQATRAFIQFCTAAGRRCLWIQPALSLSPWVRALAAPNLLKAKSWKAIPKNRRQNSGAWKAILLDAHREAIRAGSPGLGVILDARRLEGAAARAWERALEEFLPAHSISALCLYQIAPGATGKQLLPFCHHPCLIVDGRLGENPFYFASQKRSGSRKGGLGLKEALALVSEFQQSRRASKLPSARRQSPEEAKVAREKLNLIVQNLGEGVDIINQDLVIEYQNDFLAQRFPDALGRKCHQVYRAAEAPCDPCPALKAITTGAWQRSQVTARDGRIYELTSSPFTDTDGKVKAIEVVRDITARQQAKADLLASEARYRALFEHSHEALLFGSIEGKILEANPAAAQLLGYAREELIGLPVAKLLPPEDRQQLPQILETLRQQGQFEGEFENLRKDGSRILVEVRGTCFTVAGKERILILARDITEPSRAETQLREAEERYRSLVEGAPEAIAFGKKGLIQFANPAFAALFGFDHPRELIGISQLDLVAPEDQDKIEAYTRQRILGKAVPSRYEFKGRHRNGKILDLEISVSQFTMSGELYTQGLMRDVSVRKQIEAALRESEEKYRRLTAAAPAVICRLSPQGQTLWVNEHLLQVTGYRPEEVAGRNWWQVFYPGELRDQVDQLYRDFGRGDVSGYLMTLQGKDGRRRTLAWNSANLVGPGGDIQEIVGVGLDVTARRQAEAEQARLREQLLQTQKMEAISALAGGIAHHFNNLLGAILGHASLLKMKLSETDPFYRPLDAIEQAGQRASELTRELLGFARGGAYAPAPTDLNRVTQSVLALVNRIFDPAIVIESQLQPDLWPILGDAAHLEPQLLNLCLHARDAMPEGGRLFLSTRNLILDEDFARRSLGLGAGAYVVLAVRDTGRGLSAQEQERIFEPFFALPPEGRGSGLGLAMIGGIVKSHRGQIQVESETRPDQDHGTCFRIYFPALQEARVEKAKAPLKEAPAGRETVLVVDDEALVRELLGQELAFLGYRPLLAAGGEEACRLLRQHRPEVDLVILDWILPGPSGQDTFRELREIKPSLKVLLSSGYGQDGPIQETLRDGAQGFIQKPYLIQELAQTLRRLLDQKLDSRG